MKHSIRRGPRLCTTMDPLADTWYAVGNNIESCCCHSNVRISHRQLPNSAPVRPVLRVHKVATNATCASPGAQKPEAPRAVSRGCPRKSSSIQDFHRGYNTCERRDTPITPGARSHPAAKLCTPPPKHSPQNVHNTPYRSSSTLWPPTGGALPTTTAKIRSRTLSATTCPTPNSSRCSNRGRRSPLCRPRGSSTASPLASCYRPPSLPSTAWQWPLPSNSSNPSHSLPPSRSTRQTSMASSAPPPLRHPLPLPQHNSHTPHLSTSTRTCPRVRAPSLVHPLNPMPLSRDPNPAPPPQRECAGSPPLPQVPA